MTEFPVEVGLYNGDGDGEFWGNIFRASFHCFVDVFDVFSTEMCKDNSFARKAAETKDLFTRFLEKRSCDEFLKLQADWFRLV